MVEQMAKTQCAGRLTFQWAAIAVFCGAYGYILPAGAQTSQDQKTQSESRDHSRNEIIVEGYPNADNQPAAVRTPPAVSALNSRKAYEYSEMLATCAVRSKLSSTALLRAVVDGDVNSSAQSYAQDRLKRTYISCGEGPGLLNMNNPEPPSTKLIGPQRGSRDDLIGNPPGGTDGSPLGRSVYDRGAVTIRALKTFVPDLSLTAAQTGDPAVQSRFNLREMPRNRSRLPVDQLYFQVAVCIVRVAPELSVRLAMGDRAATAGGLQATLLNRARVCVGNAKKIYVDATQFRLYIADALYRWTVAARNVDSLIP